MDNSLSQHDYDEKLISYLEQFITSERLERINSIIKFRTRHLTVVLEDVFQSHNVSAVLRSCEIFGVHDVHIIENENQYNINPDVALGASKWLDIHRYNRTNENTTECLTHLKKQNYRIVAASPHENNCLLEELPLDEKVALVFGTELEGLTSTASQMADDFVKIPMFGFTESLNISVSAAICLYLLSGKMRNSSVSWQLNDEDLKRIKLNWLKSSIKNSEALIKRYLEDNGSDAKL